MPDLGGANREEAQRRFELALDECLDQILIHHTSPSDCLRRYPDIADELAPLLQVASSLALLPETQTSSEFRQETWRRVLGYRGSPAKHTVQMNARADRPRVLRNLLIGFAVALIMFGISWSGISATEMALPGMPLYSVKRQAESVQLALASGLPSEPAVRLMLAERRLDEAEELARIGSEELAEQVVTEYDAHMSSALDSLEKAPPEVQPKAAQTFGERLSFRQKELAEQRAGTLHVDKPSMLRALKITERGLERVGKIKSSRKHPN